MVPYELRKFRLRQLCAYILPGLIAVSSVSLLAADRICNQVGLRPTRSDAVGIIGLFTLERNIHIPTDPIEDTCSIGIGKSHVTFVNFKDPTGRVISRKISYHSPGPIPRKEWYFH